MTVVWGQDSRLGTEHRSLDRWGPGSLEIVGIVGGQSIGRIAGANPMGAFSQWGHSTLPALDGAALDGDRAPATARRGSTGTEHQSLFGRMQASSQSTVQEVLSKGQSTLPRVLHRASRAGEPKASSHRGQSTQLSPLVWGQCTFGWPGFPQSTQLGFPMRVFGLVSLRRQSTVAWDRQTHRTFHDLYRVPSADAHLFPQVALTGSR